MQKRCAAEFIGTFLYIFFSEAAAVNSDTQGVVVNALGNGLTLAVLIWCFSGAILRQALQRASCLSTSSISSRQTRVTCGRGSGRADVSLVGGGGSC